MSLARFERLMLGRAAPTQQRRVDDAEASRVERLLPVAPPANRFRSLAWLDPAHWPGWLSVCVIAVLACVAGSIAR